MNSPRVAFTEISPCFVLPGKRTCPPHIARLPRNYPRSHGERALSPLRVFCSWELPPLTRGKARPAWHAHNRKGITPARAGKSFPWCVYQRGAGNYPRSRGEKVPPPRIYPNVGELPPLARGKVWGGNKGYGFRGITPARAGKSWAQILPGKVAWNYPRSRGEKCPNSVSIFCLMELPPLARGKGYFEEIKTKASGITPARAGKRCL
ncbi:hypothetical protein HMPREF3198_02032 [Winkia neuii]|nr:hypothetical protein HMPREF3198_02032 [Winkia neuii]